MPRTIMAAVALTLCVWARVGHTDAKKKPIKAPARTALLSATEPYAEPDECAEPTRLHFCLRTR